MINYQSELNEEQYKVVKEGDGPCLVLAGAGSGKTRTVTYRVAWLLEQGVAQEHILMLTFTNKAAKEMKERIHSLVGIATDGIAGGTFHSFAVRQLRQYATLLGYSQQFTIVDADDSEGLMSQAMRDEGIDLKSKFYPKPKQMLFISSFARNAQITIMEALEARFQGYSRVHEVIERSYSAYTQKKRDAQVMDFDDLLEQFLLLLVTHQSVRDELAQRFQYILVDEYQDTNKIQSCIVNQLASHHKNVLVVGDDAQSIYSFRAADINNILGFEQQYVGAKVFRLEMNYRSVPEILELANNVIVRNKEQYKKQLLPMNERFHKPRLVVTNNQFEEASYIADSVAHWIDGGISGGEIAVLFRATFHSQMIEVELMKRGIPYDYRGGLRFFERAHIKDVLSFLRIAQNVHDVIAWQRVLKMQTGIGDKTAGKIIFALKEMNSISDVAMYDIAHGLPERDSDSFRDVCTMLTAIVNCSGKVEAMISAILTSGYQEYLDERYDNAHDRVQDIEQLITYAHKVKSLEQFLTETSLSDDYAKGKKADGSRVVLSTIHQSKGLEWDCVCLIRLVNGGLPNDRAKEEAGGYEEERRLFYVAITRARRYLLLTYPLMGGYDGMTMYEPSVFLSEIDPELLDDGVTDEAMIVRDEEGEELSVVTLVDSVASSWKGKSFLSDVRDL